MDETSQRPELSVSKLAEKLSDTAGLEISLDAQVVIVSPRGRTDMEFLRELCQKERDGVMQLVHTSGAVVLRGFDVQQPKHHEDLMTNGFGFRSIYTADYHKLTQSVMKAADRAPRDGGTLLNLPVDPALQGPHIENGWRSRRPRYISFWCELEPLSGGETALFDMSDSFERLHNDLRTHFERYASIYPAYGERFAIHSVLIHPQTRRKCLVLWYIESPLAEYAVAAYVKTEHFKSRKAPLPVEPNRAVNYPLQHLFRRDEGEVSLSEAQTQDLMDVAYAGARYLTWKKGDVLIVDNIAAAHGRMPCQSARRLVAGYWNEEDVRQYSTYPELADDCPSTMAANASRSPEYVKRVMSDLKAGKFKM